MLSIYLLYPAHLPIQNIGEFYNGILHPFLVPAHAMAILATALLIAFDCPNKSTVIERSRLFMGALVTGLLSAALGLRIPVGLPLLIATGIIVLGTALYPRLPTFVRHIGPLITGVIIGFDSTFDSLNENALWWCTAGCFIGISFATFYAARLISIAQKPWQQTGIRILAAWLGAICLLMVALHFKK